MTIFQTMASKIHVAVCIGLKSTGVTARLPLIHLPGHPTAQTTNSLYMIPMSQDETYGNYQQGVKASSGAQSFEFALQTGFSGDVAIGDSIGPYNGEMFQIDEIGNDQVGAIYTCKCTHKTARSLGANE